MNVLVVSFISWNTYKLLALSDTLRPGLERVSITPATPVHKMVTASLLLKGWAIEVVIIELKCASLLMIIWVFWTLTLKVHLGKYARQRPAPAPGWSLHTESSTAKACCKKLEFQQHQHQPARKSAWLLIMILQFVPLWHNMTYRALIGATKCV